MALASTLAGLAIGLVTGFIRWADALNLKPPDDYSFELSSLFWTRIAQYRALGEPDLDPLLRLIDDYHAGYSASAAPLIAGCLLLTGVSGGEFGECRREGVGEFRRLARSQ